MRRFGRLLWIAPAILVAGMGMVAGLAGCGDDGGEVGGLSGVVTPAVEAAPPERPSCRTVEEQVSLPATLEVEIDGCDNHPGPTITASAHVALEGLRLRWIFANQIDPEGAPHSTEVVRDVELVPMDYLIEIPKQPVRGGATGNPHVFVQRLGADGEPLGDPIYLGKCNQLCDD